MRAHTRKCALFLFTSGFNRNMGPIESKVETRAWKDARPLSQFVDSWRPLRGARWDNQLKYLDDYLSDPEMKCGTIVVEPHYIDKHFIEDFAAFYSRSLESIPNYCKRLHFFRGTPAETDGALEDLRNLALKHGKEGKRNFLEAAKRFSAASYIGFTCLRPLPGAPVGTTVLAHFGDQARDNDVERHFNACREYTSHLGGIPLTVTGLAFQQQDVGVAACATTAIWTSLQKTRDIVEMAATSPARITLNATDGFALGRVMPSEGLTLEQVCSAINSFDLSPHLTTVTAPGMATWVIEASLRSGHAPILWLCDEHTGENHAVAAVGLKYRKHGGLRARSYRSPEVLGLYVHDDRLGPYVLAQLSADSERLCVDLRIYKEPRQPGSEGEEAALDRFEGFVAKNIIIPMPPKVRLSYAELLLVAMGGRPSAVFTEAANRKDSLYGWITAAWRRVSDGADSGREVLLRVRTELATSYLENALVENRLSITDPGVLAPLEAARLSRTLGLLEFDLHPDGGTITVVIDTTSTSTAPHVSAVLAAVSTDRAHAVAEGVVRMLRPSVRIISRRQSEERT